MKADELSIGMKVAFKRVETTDRLVREQQGTVFTVARVFDDLVLFTDGTHTRRLDLLDVVP